MLTPTPPHPSLRTYYRSDGDRESFVSALFDATAAHYDWICRIMAIGSGQSYRRQALLRAGLGRGMRLLDVATGTGLVARSAVSTLGPPGMAVGVDASRGMLRQAVNVASIPVVQGRGEALPFRDDFFDLVSMGYALRHMADLATAFQECLRVLKPGGRLLVLEVSRPQSQLSLWMIRMYLQKVLPSIIRIGTRNAHAELLTKYYWDTIATCVPPETILGVLEQTGFVAVVRRVYRGLCSEYTGRKPQ